MTTNQTIDGVPRADLQEIYEQMVADWVSIDGEWGPCGMTADEAMDKGDLPALAKLRALLDKTDADIPASMPKGEPVAMMNDGREGEPCIWFSRPPSGTKLYAEQPAPVAPTTINYGALDPVERLAVCRGEVAPVAVVLPEREMYCQYLRGVIPDNRLEVEAHKDGWNACLDELKRLNPSL